jgi:hypothetical protein
MAWWVFPGIRPIDGLPAVHRVASACGNKKGHLVARVALE